MAKQSVSERIRKMLAEGKSVKEISKKLKCSAGLVYQVRAYDKKKVTPKKAVKPQEWVMVEASTSKEPIGIPKDVFYEHMQPLDHYRPQPSLFQRIKNWFMGV